MLCAAARHEHKIIAAGKLVLQRAVRGTDDTLAAVAFHGVAQFCADGYADTTNSRTVFTEINNQCRICVGFSAMVKPAEIRVFFQRNRGIHRFASLVGQLFSALSSSAGKNFSAASGRHSLAEAVFHFTMPLFGLIRSFHRSILHFTKPDPFAARRVPAQPSITEAEPRTCALRKVERRSPAQNKSASSNYILQFVDLSTPLSVFGGKIPACAIPCGVRFSGNKI